MAISKTEFKNAFREVGSMEYEEIPADENSIDYCFSERFEKKMEKLIQSQKKAHWHYVNTAGKRVAVAALICLMLFTTACGIKPVREAVAGFLQETYERFIRYFGDGDVEGMSNKNSISYEYRITMLPETFTEIEKIDCEILITTVYENEEGEIIEFSQGIVDEDNYYLDNERGSVYTINISGVETVIYDSVTMKHAMWLKDGYYFHIAYYGTTEIEEISSMIESIK